MISKTVIYGTISTWLGKKADEKHTHEWICYVRGQNNEDISYFVEKVVFVLHSSFDEPSRAVMQPPYVIQERGWGQFEIQIKIYLKGGFEAPLIVNHMLRLYSSNNQNTPLSKKPVVHEQQDEVVFVNPRPEVLDILQNPPQALPLEVEQVVPMEEETDNQNEEPMTAVQHYKRMRSHFLQFDDKDHKQKLENALQFINQDLLVEHFRRNRQLDEEIQNLEFEIFELQAKLGSQS